MTQTASLVEIEESTRLDILLAASEAIFRWFPLGRLLSEAECLALLTPAGRVE